eukprot:350755-Chlamydomonas_euryale.AAC.4
MRCLSPPQPRVTERHVWSETHASCRAGRTEAGDRSAVVENRRICSSSRGMSGGRSGECTSAALRQPATDHALRRTDLHNLSMVVCMSPPGVGLGPGAPTPYSLPSRKAPCPRQPVLRPPPTGSRAFRTAMCTHAMQGAHRSPFKR